jgi:anthraniloyl-CoA monooxygenase
VNVVVVGGGPAGLYLAILLRKARPDVSVRVLERNAPDATFGFGVVFSEETLGALRDADPETHLAITDTFARWDRIDIRYRDRLLRSRGHSFSAIARRRLLEILQARARALGAELEFGVEVDRLPEADLVVGADGVNSFVRRQRDFGTRVQPEGSKYVWFGTDLVFDAFTFVFRETEHGLFNVHAYPYDESMSTFIVECPEPVWRSAGLDEMDEGESLAFCERLFANDLRGHELFSNRSVWLDFPKVTNRAWHDGRVVLLGDAAHTAHFSIGSGTKLALEDAIALANALERRGWDIDASLVDYELERGPAVERLQAAASESAAHFRRIGSYAHLEPVQFAFNLLTRSGRITHARLGVRDPAFTRALDAWFAGGDAEVAAAPLFAPLRLRGLRLPNRLVAAPGAPLAAAGLRLSGFVAVSPEGRINPETPTIDDWVPGEGPVALQLGHAGRRGATQPGSVGVDVPLADPWPLVSASPIPYAPFAPLPRELDESGMAAVRDRFVGGARRATELGVAVLELDFAHGYLLGSFLSPLSNRRTDAHGTDRLRFPLSVLDAVRAVWDGPLAVRLSLADWSPRGLGVDDGIAIARALVEHGCDLVHVEAGQTVSADAPEYRRGFLAGLSDRVRNEARVPTLVRGHLTTLDDVDTLVAAGRADLCVVDLDPARIETVLDAGGHEAPLRPSNRLLLGERPR